MSSINERPDLGQTHRERATFIVALLVMRLFYRPAPPAPTSEVY